MLVARVRLPGAGSGGPGPPNAWHSRPGALGAAELEPDPPAALRLDGPAVGQAGDEVQAPAGILAVTRAARARREARAGVDDLDAQRLREQLHAQLDLAVLGHVLDRVGHELG